MAPPRPTHILSYDETYPDPNADQLTCRLFGHVRTLTAPSRCYCGHELGHPTSPTAPEA